MDDLAIATFDYRRRRFFHYTNAGFCSRDFWTSDTRSRLSSFRL